MGLVPLARGSTVRARVVVPVACAVSFLLGGYSCSRAKRALPTDASSGGDAETRPTSAGAVFSAPIGAARIDNLDVIAGLVAAEGTVRLVGVAESGVIWSADALHGVAWAPDAELRLQAAGGGFTVFWRGMHDGKATRTLALVGPRGEPRGPPIEVGSSFCATADGLAWIEPHTAGPTRLRGRRWSDTESKEVLTVPRDRDASLVCGDHDVIVLEEGEDDLRARAFVPGDSSAQPPVVVLRDSDFRDDEREHDAYSIGDDLGLVRVAASGVVAIREVPHGRSPTPWRNLEHTLSSEDDIVAVDADVSATLIVAARESEGACADGGSTSESVRAIKVDRRTEKESLVDIAAPDCDRLRGPFWIAQAPGGAVIAWVERRTEAPPKSAAISGAAFRVLADGGVRPGRIEAQADAFVNGGCDDHRCSAVALLREPGSDGMRPAPIRVFGYP
jgi:hypothetical protein